MLAVWWTTVFQQFLLLSVLASGMPLSKSGQAQSQNRSNLCYCSVVQTWWSDFQFFIMCCFCFSFLLVHFPPPPCFLRSLSLALPISFLVYAGGWDFQGCFSLIKISPVLLFHPCVHYKLQVAFPYAHLSGRCGFLETLNHRIAVIRYVCSAQLPVIEPG